MDGGTSCVGHTLGVMLLAPLPLPEGRSDSLLQSMENSVAKRAFPLPRSVSLLVVEAGYLLEP